MNSVNGDRRLPQISRIKSGIVGGPSILTGYHVIGKLDISQIFFCRFAKVRKMSTLYSSERLVFS